MSENTQEKSLEQDTVTHIFRIEGTHWKENVFPSLNDWINEYGKHPMAGGRMKKSMEQVAIASIRRDLKGWKAEKRVSLDIVWGEKKVGQRRDFDNVVAAGRKFINDALVKSGTIKDDNPTYLMYGRNKFVYTDKPFIEVRIIEDL
jgi:Holliday junction resolvase RusA-like endonuclease